MIASYPEVSLVKTRIVLGALAVGTFVATLAFSSWHEGLWHSAGEPPMSAVAQPDKGIAVPRVAASPAADASAVALTSTPPVAAAAAAAAMNPPPTVASPETSSGEPQYQQNVNPGVDIEAVRRDRGVQHGSGSH